MSAPSRDRKAFRSLVAIATIVTLTLLLAGLTGTCGAAARKDKDKKALLTPLTPEKLATLDATKPKFTYDSLGRQDPFRPFVDFSQLERTIPTDPTRPLTPLEKFSLNQYHLVGIILAGEGHNYALVEDPERVGYTVREGDYIGNQSGRVSKISENEMVVEEPYLDIFDKRQIRTIVLRLHEIEEESYAPPQIDSH